MTEPALVLAFGGPPSHDDEGTHAPPLHQLSSASRASEDTPSETASDSVLVAQTRDGDRAAFEVLVRRYHLRLVTTATSMLGARDVAEDVVQDVLLSIWVNRAQWTPVSGAAVYLFGAVANRVRNVWRGGKRAQEATARLERESLLTADVTSTPDAIANDVAEVWEAVARLPERWQQGIVLRYVRDASMAEVSRAMGISENAAKKLLRRALDALADALGSASTE